MAQGARDRAWIARLEQAYAASPARYRLRLVLFAGFGHAVLVVGLLGCTALLLAIAIRIAIRPQWQWEAVIPGLVVAATAATLFRGLWLPFSAPPGECLASAEAPALHAEVDRIRRQIGARPLDGIFIDGELNAAAVHLPRAAGLLPGRHYLILGLPLLQLLDRNELAAVVAHEFGHFQADHGRFPAWIYRVRLAWRRVAVQLEGRSFAAQIPLRVFLRWYVPRLEALSLVVARQQELAADAVAARVAGPAAAGRALARIALASEWLERCFWPDLERSAFSQGYPPLDVQRRVADALASHRAAARPLPRSLLLRELDLLDTHPTLGRRLQALDAGIEVLPAAAEIAAHTLLDQVALQRLEDRLSRAWRDRQRTDWAERHQRAQRALARSAILTASSTRTPGETLELAMLLEAQAPDADVAGYYEEVLHALPAHPAATARLGLARLREGRYGEGAELLRRAVALAPTQASDWLSGLHDLAARRQDDVAVRALAEGLGTPAVHPAEVDDGGLAHHALAPAQLDGLVQILSSHERIAAAWLVSRAGGNAVPEHWLLVDWRGSVASEATVLPRLAAQFDGPAITVLGSTTPRALAKRIRLVAGTPFHRRA